MVFKSINPSNYEILGEYQISSDTEIKAAVKNAHRVKYEWKDIGVEERVKYLTRVYQTLDDYKTEIAEHDTKDMGFPITQCHNFNLGDGLTYFKWYLDNAAQIIAPETTYETDSELHQVFYEPYGVAAVIQPWNFPFCQWSWSVVPALLAGNPVIFKPSEEVPYANKYLESLIKDCNLPSGVLQFVYGDGKTGDALVHQDIDLIIFTGSIKTGQYLYKVAAEKFIPALLELGGSAPGIIFADANINDATEAVFWQRFANCGQTCDGLKRLIVHESIFDEVINILTEKLKTSQLGDPLDPKTIFGPLVADRQVQLLEAQVQDAVDLGAKVLIGGKKPAKLIGSYYEPTILTNINTNMRVWQEEVFGPVLPVVSFKSDSQAIKLANDTHHGLGSYLYTKDKNRMESVAAQIEAGMVSVNGLNYVIPQNPFGGYKLSGLGREHGHFGLEDLTQVKVIARPK